MRKLREDTFSRNKNDDAHEYVENFWTLMGNVDINTLTIEPYLALTRGNQSLGVVKLRDWEQCCVLCRGKHLNKECPLNEEVKGVKEVKYGEFGRSFPNNVRNKARYRMGPSRYYMRMENRPPFGEKKPSLEELINKHIDKSTRRRTRTEDLMEKLQGNTYMNIRNQNTALKNLETQIEQLTKDFQAKANNDAQSVGTCSNDTNKLHGVSFISKCDVQVTEKKNEGSSRVLSCQLPPKELKP
nr:DNA-binding pseudobarrel domain-containing protein [Tanacetum cinerariifolium]